MAEALEHFYNRIWTDFVNRRVHVYQAIRGKGNPEIWSLEQAKQYVNYLEQNENP